MSIQDAKLHLDEAMRFLTLEAWQGRGSEEMRPVEDFTIAEELERFDRAFGPAGKSPFARMADDVRSAYVEIKAAREALK